MNRVLRVGLADDDATVRITLAHVLKKAEGIELVTCVEDGEPAVRLAQSGRIDVLVLDLEMPNMSGAEALGHIRDVAPHVRVVIHSSRPAATHAARMLELGAAAYLEKPCTPALLLEVVREAALPPMTP